MILHLTKTNKYNENNERYISKEKKKDWIANIMAQHMTGDYQIYMFIFLCTGASYEECSLTGIFFSPERTKSTLNLFYW